ncbi:unnamed protein product [Urochloa humidicola]
MPALIAGRHSALLRRCAAGGDLSLSRSSTLRPWLVGAFRTAPWIPYRPRAALLPLWGAPPRPPGVRWNALALHARLLLSAFGPPEARRHPASMLCALSRFTFWIMSCFTLIEHNLFRKRILLNEKELSLPTENVVYQA